MSGGGYRGKSFGPRGAHYNNSRPDGHDDRTRRSDRRGGRSRGNNRHHRNYSHDNFDNSSLSRCSRRSQNDNWSTPRSFSRWDQSSNNQQSTSSPSSSSTTSSPALHNQSPSSTSWSQNNHGDYQNKSVRFQYNNNSHHYYNRGGRGFFSHGGYRFPSLRGPQNFFSPYYSAPYRDNACNQHGKEVVLEEPTIPLLGSEEERQQKITEAADELKRKLLFTSVTNDDVNIGRWDDDDPHSQSIKYDESNAIKLIPELKHGPPELNLTPNDLKDIGKLNDKDTIDPIIMHDCNVADKSSDTTVMPIHHNIIHNNDDINTNSIVITTTNVNISDKSDNIIEKQVIQTTCSVDTIKNSEDSVLHTVSAENFKVDTTATSNTVAETAVTETSDINEEFVQAMIIDETPNVVTTVADTSNSNKLLNTEVPDLTVTNSSTTKKSLHAANDNQTTQDKNVSCANNTQKISYLSNFTVRIPPEKKDLNLIQFLENQTDKSKVNNEQEKNNQLISKSSTDYNQDNSSGYCGTIINCNFSEPSDVLQPPPLPPSLPQPSYESKESNRNILPEYNSIINPSNISSNCGTFHPSSTFDSHIPVIPPIISTTSVVNSSINVSAPLPGYSIGQGYIPMAPYAAGVSLAYPPIVPALEYVSTQTVPPLPPPLPHSPPILQDVCASSINEDDDVLDELKEAMEFAKQCMIMGNDNDAEEEDIGFPTFPDLPPIMPETAPPENPKVSKKIAKCKKAKQGMFGPHLEAIAKAKEKSMNANVETNINSIINRQTADDTTRRKIVFNLNSKFKVLNKNEDVWMDESREEMRSMMQRKLRPLSPVTIGEKHENSKSDSKSNEIEKSDKTKDSEKHKMSGNTKETGRTGESEKIEGSGKIKEREKIKEPERTKECKKTKEPEKNLKRDNKSESNNYRKGTDLIRPNDKDRHEPKKKMDKFESSLSNNIAKKNLPSSPISRKWDKTKTDNNIVNTEKYNASRVQSSPSNKSAIKITAPTSLNESSWKDRVIGRFLKMSKNDIQNMINNSSLRKFDIAMQHLVKEKKSSLSMEMRNHEDEKMKTSTYDNEDFMSQLQAILDPAATVDVTNLPTNFIHQLSEVLHLESFASVNAPSTVESDKNNEPSLSSIQESSTSSKIDPKPSSESSRCVETNIPVISTYDMSKSWKIDNRVSKDTVKNESSTVVETTACTRAGIKRGQINKTKNQHKQSKVTPLSVILASSGNDNEIEVDDPDVMIVENASQTKRKKSPLKINTKITTAAPSVINTTSTAVIERLSLVDTPTTTTTSTVIPRIETPIVTRVARQAVELDKLFTAGISKAKAACRTVNETNAGSTIDETILDTRTRQVMQRGTKRGDITESTWSRKGIEDADIYRNLTKEEYEAQYGESSSPNMSFEDEYRKISAVRSRKVSGTVREVVCHTTHLDKSTLCEFHSPLRAPSQNMLIETEGDGVESDSQNDSDTSSSSSSDSSSDVESSLIDVSKVLKFIKEREKMAKKKSINEEIRDEVTAEIDKRRREKSAKHKSHKTRSKKREKRKKEKKIKKKKPKKKRRHKSYHVSHSDDDVAEKNELPLRLLNDHEIKREPSNEEPPKTVQEVPRATAEPRRSVHAKKTLTAVAISSLLNKSVDTEASMTIPQDSLTIAPTPSVSSIIPTSNSTASTFKTNPMLNSPSLIVTVMNTNVANSSAATPCVSNSSSIVTSSLRTVTAVTLPCGMTPQSSIQHLKTKAQLKQMPETIRPNQNKDSKIIEQKTIDPKVYEQKLIEPVSSTSENQIANSEQSVSLSSSNQLSIPTPAVTTTQTGPKKLDIKAYHERAFQRKLKEQNRIRDLVQNPTQLTQNLLVLPSKAQTNELPPVDGESSGIANQPEISANASFKNIIDKPNCVVMKFSSNEPVLCASMSAKNSIQLNAVDKHSQEIDQNQLNPTELSKIIVTSDCQQHDEISESNTATAKLTKNNVKAVDKKFINIKSEGGKELKLKEKVKKRPKKITTSTATTAVTLKKVNSRNKPKRPIMPIAKNIEMTIDNSPLLINIQSSDGKDNYRDNNSSNNIETDALSIVQKKPVVETNESLLQVNDAIITNEKLPQEIDPIKNTEDHNIVETLRVQSEVIENKLNYVESQNKMSIFSHYFKFTKGLISDNLPDTIPQERTELEISPLKLPEMVKNEKDEEEDIKQITPSKSTLKNEDKTNKTSIATPTPTDLISETKIPIIITEDIPVKVEKSNNSHSTENLLEIRMAPEDVSSLLKDDFNHEQPSTSIISDKNIPSPLSVRTTTEPISFGSNVITDKNESTELLSTSILSKVDTTISSTYDVLHVDSNKTQSYDQLTLDELSDISMDELCNSKELSQESKADTELLSEAENNIAIVNLLGKNPLPFPEDKNKDVVPSVEKKIDDCQDYDDNKDHDSIIHAINKNQVSPCNENSITEKNLQLNDHYEESSHQPTLLLDRTSSIEESHNVLHDNSLSFSKIKLATPKLIEEPVLNDNDKTELIHNSHELRETPEGNNSLDVASTINAIVEEKKTENFTPISLNNSPPLRPPSLSNYNIVQSSSSVLNEKLIEVVDKTPTEERLSSPILQVPSKSSNNIDEDDNTIENDTNISKVTEKENTDCQSAVNNAGEIDDEVVSKNLDFSKTNELLINSNQFVIESPTSTTRNIETNSSGRDESERSSSEARSVEPNRMQREISFESSTPEANRQHINRDSLRKSSKSSTRAISHKKHKRHHRDRKMHKLTLGHVEDAIVTNVVNLIPKPTTKGAVISRMQEIDIAIQQLMNEKMRLYQMLQTDEWPISQNEDTGSEVVKFKEIPYLSSDRSVLTKEPRIVASRSTETVNVEGPTTSEISTAKSQISTAPKNETSKTLKVISKSDDKCLKNGAETLPKISKKRKHHHDRKDSHKNKEMKIDESIMIKQRLPTGESLGQKNKSQTRIKNSVSGQRKPVKLSQLLAREFKPKESVEKHKTESPTINDNSRSNSRLESEQIGTHSTIAEMTKASPASDELFNEVDSSDISSPKNTLSQEDHDKIIYTDESSSDVINNFNNKQERSTGLSLLERSIKREMAAKKIMTRTTDADSSSSSSSKLTSNKKQQHKKLRQNTNMKLSKKNKNHMLEVIDAVAKNCINDLYANVKSPEKKQKTSKNTNQQLTINEETKNKQKILVTMDHDSENNENKAIRHSDNLKKYLMVTSKEDDVSTSSVVEWKQDAKIIDNDSVIISSKDKDELDQSKNSHEQENDVKKTILEDWSDSPHVSDSEFNQSMVAHVNSGVIEKEKKSKETTSFPTASAIDNSEIEKSNDALLVIEKPVAVDSTTNASTKLNEKKELWNDSISRKNVIEDSRNERDCESSMTKRDHNSKRSRSVEKEVGKPKSTGKQFERSKFPIKEIGGLKSTGKELEHSKIASAKRDKSKSTVKELEQSKSIVKDVERSKSTLEKVSRPKSTVKELEQPKSTVKELERPTSAVKELERSKSTVKELERSKSSVKESEQSKLTVKELERSKSTTKELENTKSTVGEFEQLNSSVKELERPKSTVMELERSKSSVNELDDIDSPDDNDEDNESMNRKRGRTTKRGRQSSSRRSSRQSDDSFKITSRSRSHSKRMTKSPSAHDRSTPDIEHKSRQVSGSPSSSISSKRKSNTTPVNVVNTTTDKNNLTRKRRRQNYSLEHTQEQMMNCKVRLVDCRDLYLRSDIFQRLGILRINGWTPSLPDETTFEKSADDTPSIIIDEDKNRSDDESMEIIQVDESIDLQNISSSESSTDIIVRDPLSLTPRPSPGYIVSPRDEDTSTIIDLENENEHEKKKDIASDDIEVLAIRTLTPVNIPSTSEKNHDTNSQIMQYTVHKGPILDIKVFGDSFLAASEDGAVYRYCQRSNGILNIYKGHDAAVTCLYVHEVPGTADSGNTRWNLFSGSLDATLRCYDIVNGSLDRHIADVGSPIQCMDQAWGMIFVGTKSGHISRYDIKSGCLREDNLDFSDKPVLALRASTEGARRVLIVASRNQPITIRDAQNGLYLRTISGQRTHTVYSLMRDRNLVYCGTSSTSIPVFDFISGEQVLQYTAGVGIVCMRLYRQLLFAGCYDGNIYVFDTKNAKLVCSIPGPGNMLLSMEIVDDKIIAGSKDRRLHAWQMPIQARTILAERA
ncbi:hypothetical protein PV325_001262 [Microctonus aethiopoides]|nr:hypothetical protein PV325_001262 [Microctonus aethiopoides]